MFDTMVAQNPTVITITRHSKTVNESGGITETTVELDPITVRMYHYSTRNQMEMTLQEGQAKTKVLGLLADGEADIIVGHDSYDTFVYEDRTYRVMGVRVYRSSYLNTHTQADCEAI